MMVVTERSLDDTLDPRFSDGAQDALTAERLLEVSVDERDQAQLRVAYYQQKTARYYNTRVNTRNFQLGSLVLRRVFQNTKDPGSGVLGPNWEGPYKIIEVIRPGTYKLEYLDGKKVQHSWNAEHLRHYYQ